MAVVWTDKASQHPTAYTSDNVYGTVQWVSSAKNVSEGTLSLHFEAETAETSTATHTLSLPLTDIHSFRLRSPLALRQIGSVEIQMKNQDTYTLFFHTYPYDTHPRTSKWGGRLLIDAIQSYTDLVVSLQDHGLFLVHPSLQEREYHLTPRFADDAIEAVLARRTPLKPQKTHTDTLAEWAKSTRLSVLSQLSYVTRGARQSRDAFLSHPLLRHATPHVSTSQAGPYMVSTSTNNHDKAKQTLEFDSARVYLAKWAQQIAHEGELNRLAERAMEEGPAMEAEDLLGATKLPTIPGVEEGLKPLSVQDCELLMQNNSKVNVLAQHIFRRGLEKNARPLLWPYLLGAHPMVMEVEKREHIADEDAKAYLKLYESWATSQRPLSAHAEASQHRIWIDCLRADTKHAFFHTPPRTDTFSRMQQSSWDRPSHQGTSASQINPHLYALSDILLTFVVYAESKEDPLIPSLEGYVQGMSDLCLVCYMACDGDEAKAFWSFVALMRRWGGFYVEDQSGMRQELVLLQRLVAELCPRLYMYLQSIDALHFFFCFRWLLVCFKREFALDDVLRLWEAIWASSWCSQNSGGWPLCTHFELFLSLAILESHADVMERHLKTFDEVLMYVQSLSNHMDAATVLRRAEALVYRLRSRVIHADVPPDSDIQALVQRL